MNSIAVFYIMAPSDEGDSPRCGEMSRSDRGDGLWLGAVILKK